MTDHDAKTTERTVSVLGLEDSGERIKFFRSGEERYARAAIPAAELRDRVGSFVDVMGEVLSKMPEAVAGYGLDGVTITAEISAKGQVSLLGTGGEVAGKGGLTFTFKHRP